MPRPRWTPLALTACALMTASCASFRPSPVAPPRLTLPTEADKPCSLHVLPDDPTQADLEAGYMIRGEQIALCEARRLLAVDTLKAERDLIDAWANPSR